MRSLKLERTVTDGQARPSRDRMLPPHAYRAPGRRPRLPDLPEARPPYIEIVATAVAFIFLLYVILGGA
jgi:hypothetical protein